MTFENFCYWLQGKFELDKTNKLTEEQVEDIRKHLALCFVERCKGLNLNLNYSELGYNKEEIDKEMKEAYPFVVYMPTAGSC